MDTENKSAIFYITNNGLNLAHRLKGLYPDARVLKFKPETISELWSDCRILIFIMATGIVVRTIAPLIKDKKTDPAVVVLSEDGKFAVSILSGHIGGANKIAKEAANFLSGQAVITTASDTNNLPAIDLWAKENDLVIENWELVPQIGIRLINNGRLRIYADETTEYRTQNPDLKMPEEFLIVEDPWNADVLITNKLKIPPCPPLLKGGWGDYSGCRIKGQLYVRPKNLVIGIGCNSGISADEIESAVRNTLTENNLSFSAVHSIATIDKKGYEPGLVEFAEKYGFKINTFTPYELNSVDGIPKSEAAFKATGAMGVAEPSALLASGAVELLVPKQKIGNVTVAVAEQKVRSQKSEVRSQKSEKHKHSKPRSSNSKLNSSLVTRHSFLPQGKIYIVGTGPGSIEHITPYAKRAIRRSDVIVGYGTYLDLIKELVGDKEVITTGMTQEMDRCERAIELAFAGKTVSVVSGGDPGIYAMAGLVFEVLRGQGVKGSRGQGINKAASPSNPRTLESLNPAVEVIPGIPALNACAARLGAPLMHDFAAISLSDRLTPWELIEKRLEAASISDFVIVLYNPKSKGRAEHINKARVIILKHRSPETPVGIVKAAMRDDERIIITNLKDMLAHDIDMRTTVIIGNSQTYTWNNWMVTPRGYEKKFKV